MRKSVASLLLLVSALCLGCGAKDSSTSGAATPGQTAVSAKDSDKTSRAGDESVKTSTAHQAQRVKASRPTTVTITDSGVDRQPGGKARGPVTVVLSKHNAVTLSGGTIFQTSNGLQFKTTQLYAAVASPSLVRGPYDALITKLPDGKYAFTVEVEAIETGPASLLTKGTDLVPKRLPYAFVTAYASSDFTEGMNSHAAKDTLGQPNGSGEVKTHGAEPAVEQPATPGPRERPPTMTELVRGLKASDWPPKEYGYLIGRDGFHFALVRQRGEQCKLIVNEQELPDTFDDIKHVRFSGNGQHVCYFAKHDNHWHFMIDRAAKDHEDIPSSPQPTWKPDWDSNWSPSRPLWVDQHGDHWVYACDYRAIIKDGQTIARGNLALREVIATPDCSHVAYAGEVIHTNPAMWDDTRGGTFVDGKQWSRNVADLFVVSADSSRIAAVVQKSDPYKGRLGYFVIIDGLPQELYLEISDFVLSPDGKRYAYYARSSNNRVVVLDGTERVVASGRDEESVRHLVFTGDSKHLMAVRVTRPRAYWYDHEVLRDDVSVGKFRLTNMDLRSRGTGRDWSKSQIAFSDDGQQFLYTVGNKPIVMNNDRKLLSLEGKSSVTVLEFLGSHSIVVTRDVSTGKSVVWVDGAIGREFDDIVYPSEQPLVSKLKQGTLNVVYPSNRPFDGKLRYFARDGQVLYAVEEDLN